MSRSSSESAFCINGVYYSNEDRSNGLDKKLKKDPFDMIMNELSPDHPTNFKRITRCPNISYTQRWDCYSVGVDMDSNIVVWDKNKERLENAKKIASAYGAAYSEPKLDGDNWKIKISVAY